MPIQDNLLAPKKRAPPVLPFVLVGALALGGAAFAVGRLTAGPPAPETTAAGGEGGSTTPGGAGGGTGGGAGSGVAELPQVIPPGEILPGTDGLRRVRIPIRGTLAGSLAGAVGPDIGEPLTQVITRLLVWNLDVSRQTQPGDELDVLYELPAGKEPLVQAMRYRSKELGRELRAYRYRSPDASFARYYDENGGEIELRLKDSPIDAYEQVTSLLWDGRKHKGVDFKVPTGAPVKAPWDGVITRKNWSFRGNGNCLEIADAKGRKIVFLHLDVLPRELKVGQRVRKGEVVARSGNTGRSFAPHLHYQLMAGERVLDPFKIHETYRLSLEGSARAAFTAEAARLDAILATDPAAPWVAPVVRVEEAIPPPSAPAADAR